MANSPQLPQSEISPEQADKRRDDALRRALAMPHKPHKEEKKARPVSQPRR